MKPFCYVTNMTGSQFSRQGSFKCLTQDGFTVLVENVRKLHYLFCDILPEMLENIPLQVRQQLWFQHDGAPAHLALDVNVFPNRWIGRGAPVQWPPRSPDLTPMDFFIRGGKMKCLVYETPIDTPEELVARVTEAAAIILETQSFARRYQLCINVNGHFQQLL